MRSAADRGFSIIRACKWLEIPAIIRIMQIDIVEWSDAKPSVTLVVIVLMIKFSATLNI
ncbi:hypothetical protein D3C76_1185010 [compost metagenome]